MLECCRGAKGGVASAPSISYRQVDCHVTVVLECQYVLALRRSRYRGLDKMVGLPACGGTDNDGTVQYAGKAGSCLAIWLPTGNCCRRVRRWRGGVPGVLAASQVLTRFRLEVHVLCLTADRWTTLCVMLDFGHQTRWPHCRCAPSGVGGR